MILSLALGLVLVQQPAFRTDTTLIVQSGARLDLELAVGSVTIRTWERSQVRLRAQHSARTSFDIHNSAGVLRVEAEGRMGLPGDVEVELTVPAAMGVNIEAMTVDVDAEGMRGLLQVESIDGDVAVRNAGDLSIESMNGAITVAGARGRARLSSISRDIVASGLAGEVTAESVSGSIWLTGSESAAVVAETVSGMVVFQGAVRSGGSYALASHSGNIVFGLPAGTNATVSTALASGRLTASFTLPDPETRSRRRQSLRFGNGSASVELETFSGSVRLVRPDEMPTRTDRRNRGDGADRGAREPREHGLEIAGDLLSRLDLGLAGLGVALGADLAGLQQEINREIRPLVRHGAWPGLLRDLDLELDLGLDLRLDRKSRLRSHPRSEK